MPLATFRTSVFRNIALPFLLAAILLAIGILQFGISRATITITPVPQMREFSIELPAYVGTPGDAPEQETDNNAQTRVYAQWVSASKKAQQEFPTESVRLEKGQSKGVAVIYNNRTVAQLLVRTTRLLAPDRKLFRTAERIVIPAGGTEEVPIYADKDGPEYDIPPTRFTIPGLSPATQKLVWAETKENTAGGLRKIYTVTARDIENARAQLKKQLEAQLQQDIRQSIPLGYELPPQPLTLAVLSFVPNAQAEEETEQFSAEMEAEIRGIALHSESLFSFLRQYVRKNAPSGWEEKKIITGSSSLATSSNENIASGSMPLSYSFQAELVPAVPETLIDTRILRGKKKEDAKKIIQQITQSEDVSISLSPFWIRRLPSLASHISIVVNMPR